VFLSKCLDRFLQSGDHRGISDEVSVCSRYPIKIVSAVNAKDLTDLYVIARREPNEEPSALISIIVNPALEEESTPAPSKMLRCVSELPPQNEFHTPKSHGPATAAADPHQPPSRTGLDSAMAAADSKVLS